MTLLATPKPRADLSLLPLSAGRGSFRVQHIAGWGEQMGQGQAEVIVPSELNPGRNFNPTNMVLYGRRGTGKTLTQSAILTMFARRFDDPALGRWAGVRRCMSNYWVDPVFHAGPLGATRGYIEDGNGDLHYGLIPVDPIDAEVVYKMGRMPKWGFHRLVGVDEIGDVLPGGAMARKVRDYAAVLKQQRSMRSEMLGATQAPQHIQRTNILYQIDLLVLVKPHFSTWSVELLFFDIHGSFTGNWGKHRWLPPMERDYDWSIGIGGLDKVKGLYNTYEMVAPTWWSDEDRAEFIERQWSNRPTYARYDSPFFKELPLPGAAPASRPDAAPAESAPDFGAGDPLTEAAATLDYPVTYEEMRRLLRDKGFLGNMPHEKWSNWLTEHGYRVYTDRKTQERMVNHS